MILGGGGTGGRTANRHHRRGRGARFHILPMCGGPHISLIDSLGFLQIKCSVHRTCPESAVDHAQVTSTVVRASHSQSQPIQRISFSLFMLNYSHMDSKDILYMVLAFCALWFTAFLCFALYQVARFMKRMQELSAHLREKADEVLNSINTIRMKIEGHVNAITSIGDGIRKIMDALRSRE